MSKKIVNEGEIIRKCLNNLRKFQLNEQSSKEIVVSNNSDIVTDTKNSINSSVGNVTMDDKAMVVYPESNDVVFNGMISDLNNMKFQFRFNDQSGGLYIWGDAVLLTKETINKLNKLVSIKEQWKNYWNENISTYTEK